MSRESPQNGIFEGQAKNTATHNIGQKKWKMQHFAMPTEILFFAVSVVEASSEKLSFVNGFSYMSPKHSTVSYFCLVSFLQLKNNRFFQKCRILRKMSAFFENAVCVHITVEVYCIDERVSYVISQWHLFKTLSI